MKRLLYILILFILQFSVNNVIAGDTSYIILRIRGTELIPSELDNGHYFKQQLLATLQNEWKRKAVVIIPSDDSLHATSTKFNYAIEVNILELHVNDPVIIQQTTPVSRNVTTNTYKDEAEDLRKEHTTVYADLTVTEKSMTALLRLGVSTIILSESFTLWSDIIAESYNWENKSATYTGSFQALGSKEIVLTKTKPKPAPKTEDVYRELVRQCIDKSSRKITSSLNPKTGG